jgi:hypothetical protein
MNVNVQSSVLFVTERSLCISKPIVNVKRGREEMDGEDLYVKDIGGNETNFLDYETFPLKMQP